MNLHAVQTSCNRSGARLAWGCCFAPEDRDWETVYENLGCDLGGEGQDRKADAVKLERDGFHFLLQLIDVELLRL
jgi:hypothetical protein